MDTMLVDKERELGEPESPVYQGTPAGVRAAAKFFSYVFHPVFIPLYIILFLLFIHPGVFAGFSDWKKNMVLLQATAMYAFFPLVTVLLLKALNFIDSIYLKSQRDRIIPYVACGIWYFWVWYVWKNLPDSPTEIVVLSLSIFLASSIGLMANIYMKISMHTTAMGVMLGFMTWLGLTQWGSFGVYMAVAVLIAGLVCTSRLLVSDHSRREVYAGLVAGLMGVLLGYIFT
ncbi:MAG: hypothetical protein H7Y42_19205 [Chitinophagaceae bacterium]|nr:hypothetical protein [Chitinophagaceae bacterium]